MNLQARVEERLRNGGERSLHKMRGRRRQYRGDTAAQEPFPGVRRCPSEPAAARQGNNDQALKGGKYNGVGELVGCAIPGSEAVQGARRRMVEHTWVQAEHDGDG